MENNSNINEPTKNADEKILVSVVIAAYNIEKYIGQCLDSIVNQTYKNIEILVGEDKGTDKTLVIIEEYEKRDSRIRLIKNEKNLGLHLNKKNLINLAKGDYICFLDGDDYVSEHYVENFVKNIGRADLIISGNYFFDENNKFVENKRKEELIVKDKELLSYYLLNNEKYFAVGAPLTACWGRLYRKNDLLKYIDHFAYAGAEDMLINAYIFNDISSILIIPTCDYYYRDRFGSATKTKNDPICRTIIITRFFKDFILSENKNIKEESKSEIMNNFIRVILGAHLNLLKVYKYSNPETKPILKEMLLFIKNKKISKTKYFYIAKVLIFSEKLFYLLFAVPQSIKGKINNYENRKKIEK